jgi:hypothetical protein
MKPLDVFGIRMHVRALKKEKTLPPSTKFIDK